ncbi:hypothetical protein BGZ76_001384 [Entomortierella beljakovae]|nr:hypothetical protein BGZ76_001384 [Entomortierella beljakovae]
MVSLKKSNRPRLILLLGTAVILQSVLVANAGVVAGEMNDGVGQQAQYAFPVTKSGSGSGSVSVSAPKLADVSSSSPTKEVNGGKSQKNDKEIKQQQKDKDEKKDKKEEEKDSKSVEKTKADIKDISKQVEENIEIVKSDFNQMVKLEKEEDWDIADMMEDFEKSHDFDFDEIKPQMEGYLQSMWDNIVQMKDDPRVKSKIASLSEDPDIQAGISAITEKAKEFKHKKRELAQEEGIFQNQAIGVGKNPQVVVKNPKATANPKAPKDPRSGPIQTHKTNLPKVAKVDPKATKQVVTPPQAQKVPITKVVAKEAPVAAPVPDKEDPSVNDMDDEDEEEEEEEDEEEDEDKVKEAGSTQTIPTVGKGGVKPQTPVVKPVVKPVKPGPKKGVVLRKRQAIPAVVINGAKQEAPKVVNVQVNAPKPAQKPDPKPAQKANVAPIVPVAEVKAAPAPKAIPVIPFKDIKQEPKPNNIPIIEIKDNKQEQEQKHDEPKPEMVMPKKQKAEHKQKVPLDDFIEVENDNDFEMDNQDNFPEDNNNNNDINNNNNKAKERKNPHKEEEFEIEADPLEDKGNVKGVWEAVFGKEDNEEDQVIEVQKKKHRAGHKHRKENHVEAAAAPATPVPAAPATPVPAAPAPAPAPAGSAPAPQPAQGQAPQAPQGQTPQTPQKGATPLDTAPKGAAPEGAPAGTAPAPGSPAGASKEANAAYGTVPMFGPAQLDLGSGATGLRAALGSSAWTSRIVAGVAMAVVAMMNL